MTIDVGGAVKPHLPYPMVTRMLLEAYSGQNAQVSWSSAQSKSFSAANGVKQGGVLSPLLFSVYIDELLNRLKSAGIGCHIGHVYLGTLAYADDLTLLAPNLCALKQMTNICTAFAEECYITFNAKKTLCMKVGQSATCQDVLFINGQRVQWVDSCIHLGQKINSKRTNADDCALKCSRFFGQVNRLMGNFSFLSYDVRARLFDAHCMSFYGAVNWRLNSPGFQRVIIQWRKAVRRVLRLPYQTHSWLLGPLLNRAQFQCRLEYRVAKFAKSMVVCKNDIVRCMALRATQSSQSPLGQNIAYLEQQRGVTMAYDNTTLKKILCNFNDLNDNQISIVQ